MRIRARWQNRRIQPLFPCRDTDITIHGTKYLYGNSRNQLRDCSTPDRWKVENSCIEMNENYFNLPTTTPTPNQHSSVPLEGIPAHDFSLGDKEKSGTCVQCTRFSDTLGCLWDLFSLSSDLEHWQSWDQYILDAQGAAESSRNGDRVQRRLFPL